MFLPWVFWAKIMKSTTTGRYMHGRVAAACMVHVRVILIQCDATVRIHISGWWVQHEYYVGCSKCQESYHCTGVLG